MIDLAELNKQLKIADCPAADKVTWFDQIGSTNDYILALEDSHGAVCIAGLQLKGRGRRGNRWDAPYGSSVLMSIGWRLPVQNAQGLSLACGVAVKRALENIGIENVRLKWPNDLMLKNAKLAGILIELARDKCVVGLGLNVDIGTNHVQTPHETSMPWTDLHRGGYKVDFLSLHKQLICEICDALEKFSVAGFAPFREEWNTHHLYHLRDVEVHGDRSVSGRVQGVDDRGGLVIRTSNGDCTFYAGEVSLRPYSRQGHLS